MSRKPSKTRFYWAFLILLRKRMETKYPFVCGKLWEGARGGGGHDTRRFSGSVPGWWWFTCANKRPPATAQQAGDRLADRCFSGRLGKNERWRYEHRPENRPCHIAGQPRYDPTLAGLGHEVYSVRERRTLPLTRQMKLAGIRRFRLRRLLQPVARFCGQ